MSFESGIMVRPHLETSGGSVPESRNDGSTAT